MRQIPQITEPRRIRFSRGAAEPAEFNHLHLRDLVRYGVILSCSYQPLVAALLLRVYSWFQLRFLGLSVTLWHILKAALRRRLSVRSFMESWPSVEVFCWRL